MSNVNAVGGMNRSPSPDYDKDPEAYYRGARRADQREGPSFSASASATRGAVFKRPSSCESINKYPRPLSQITDIEDSASNSSMATKFDDASSEAEEPTQTSRQRRPASEPSLFSGKANDSDGMRISLHPEITLEDMTMGWKAIAASDAAINGEPIARSRVFRRADPESQQKRQGIVFDSQGDGPPRQRRLPVNFSEGLFDDNGKRMDLLYKHASSSQITKGMYQINGETYVSSHEISVFFDCPLEEDGATIRDEKQRQNQIKAESLIDSNPDPRGRSYIDAFISKNPSFFPQ